jgi:hydrogenase maturation protease
LVIGIGNSLRRDDGAGLILARGLAEVWQTAGRRVKLLLTHQLVPELAETVAGDDVAAVLFVDAARATDDADDGCRLEPVAGASDTPSLGHHLDPALILLYAAQLFGGRPPAWLLRVPGRDFDHGEGLSPASAGAVAAQLAAADALWESFALPG